MYMCRCIYYRLWINRYFYKNSPLKLIRKTGEVTRFWSEIYGCLKIDIWKSKSWFLKMFLFLLLLLPFWRYLWPTFGWIFSDQTGSHMVRQHVESFQAWSFLLDWPVWPQNAVSHLAKSWAKILLTCLKRPIREAFFPTSVKIGPTPKSSERRFVFEIRGT